MANALNIKTNDPLNFRHSNTLITTKVPHYPTKLTTGVSIVPGWNRPNSNGKNANINDKDYNGPDFKPRPLKHWRKQLRIYNNKNMASNNSRSVTISQLQRPGLTVYHFNPDCTCVDGEAGNSYIISENKFGYETKGDVYSKKIDVVINNNGYVVVPYNATPAELNDPTNSAYKVYTGIYNTVCINCSPEGNQIKSGVAFNSQAFYTYNDQKLENRCNLYEQNISTNKAPGCNYFTSNGIPLWPDNTSNGPQVVAPVNFGSTVYKGNFFNIYNYGYANTAFGSSIQVNSASFIPKIKCNPKYVLAGFYVNVVPASLIEAAIYDSLNNLICRSTNTQYTYINPTPPFAPSSFNIAARIFYFPATTFIEAPNTYYIKFRTINSVNFNWLVENNVTNILSGTLIAEPLYCPSQTIYKPNNVSFAKQGAVSGSTRLKKIVSDTIFMNGSSFYSARGAQEANLGKYQGTNLSSNYYVKTKPVIDSCFGKVPSAPFLLFVSNGENNIVVSWYVNSNGGCNILYYTLKFQPKDVSSPTQVTIYPSDGNTYNITNLIVNTEYNVTITATNSNGTSEISNILETNTLSQVIISLTPNIYTYTYNPATFPISVTVNLFSINNIAPIIASIINFTNINVASLVYSSINTYNLIINNAGTFNIYAQQASAGKYNGSTATSPIITILPDTPVVTFPPSFNTTGTWPSSYTFIPASITYPSPVPPGMTITYTSTNPSVATITGTTVTLIMPGSFSIAATTSATQNYNSATTTSPTVTINKATPILTFPGSFNTTGTWPLPYTLVPVTITYVTGPPPSVSVGYTSTNPSVATISGTSVTIVMPGNFAVTATSVETAYYYSATTTSPTVTINKSTLTISFPGSFNTLGAWGSPYTLVPVTISYVTGPPPSVTVEYTSTNTSVATISGTTVSLIMPGNFQITAKTVESDYYYSSNTTTSPTVLVTNAPELIIYNNPRTFPRNAGISGEVGMIIGIPSGSWPNGFSNFTSVIITRESTSITLNSGSSPTYNNCLNKYLVYGEVGTAGPFINALTTSTASNIAFAGTSSIAGGASSGVSLDVTFLGGSGSGVPSTFNFILSTGPINISQGILYSKYSTITTSTIPPPDGSNLTYFITGWKGYGGSGFLENTSTIQQAWGITSNSSSPPNPTASPLISSGAPPNHIFYSQTNAGGTSYYYYIGIPKMISPNY